MSNTMSVAEQFATALTGTPQKESSLAKPTGEVEDSQEEVDETPEEVEVTVESGADEVEDEQEDKDDEEELPPNIKDILSKNRKALREAEARATAAEKALAAKDKAPDTNEPAPVDDKFKNLYVTSAAKSALVAAGITTGTDRFLKMLDLSSVEVDDSGNITGLDDQIADIKADFKDVLTPKKVVTKVDGAGRRPTPSVPKTSAERLAAQFG